MSNLIKIRDFDDELSLSVTEIAQFGTVTVPESILVNHVLFVGATGSGKSTLLKIMLRFPFSCIGTGTGCDRRALVVDVDGDMLSVLVGMAPRADIVLMNPLDQRSCSWDVSRDISSPDLASDFAFTLFPKLPESQPFFSDAVRVCAYNVIKSFQLSGVEWSLADILRVLKSLKNLKAILGKHAETRDVIKKFFREEKLAASILSEAETLLMPYEPVAAAWEHAHRKVSLEDWSQSEMILVLGTSHRSEIPLQILNRCIIQRAAAITLDAASSTTRRNYFVLDELSSLGKLNGFVTLAKQARKKGTCILAALQAVDGLRDPELYGPNFSEEILAQFGTKFIGLVESPKSAQWASELVGDHEVEQVTESSTSARLEWSTTTSTVKVDKSVYLPSDFMSLPPCDYHSGLTGLFFARGIGMFFDHIPGNVLFDELLPPADQSVKNFVRRSADCMYLRAWMPERARELGIPEIGRHRDQNRSLSDRSRELQPKLLGQDRDQLPTLADKLRDLDDLFQ